MFDMARFQCHALLLLYFALHSVQTFSIFNFNLLMLQLCRIGRNLISDVGCRLQIGRITRQIAQPLNFGQTFVVGHKSVQIVDLRRQSIFIGLLGFRVIVARM